jgi:hypothetical protein
MRLVFEDHDLDLCGPVCGENRGEGRTPIHPELNRATVWHHPMKRALKKGLPARGKSSILGGSLHPAGDASLAYIEAQHEELA